MDRKAYVFTAKSGVRKTTHTRFWLECFQGRAGYINGDKPILRCREGRWLAYRIPWMEKENLGVPKSAPMQAVCFIERGQVNEIYKIKDEKYDVEYDWAKKSLEKFLDDLRSAGVLEG